MHNSVHSIERIKLLTIIEAKLGQNGKGKNVQLVITLNKTKLTNNCGKLSRALNKKMFKLKKMRKCEQNVFSIFEYIHFHKTMPSSTT